MKEDLMMGFWSPISTPWRILVVDSEQNIKTAEKYFARHTLTTASSFRHALELIRTETFNMAIINQELPMDSAHLRPESFHEGELVPYGIYLAAEAARRLVKHIAVIEDFNHHASAMSALLDDIKGPIRMWDTPVSLLHSHALDGIRDWGSIITRMW